jgi:hypothetical protein
MRWVRLPRGDDVPVVYRWLRDHGRPGSLLVMPLSDAFRSINPLYLFFALTHRRPLLNGYPAFTPNECVRVLTLAERLPSPKAIDMLRQRGIRYIVLDRPNFERMKRQDGPARFHRLYRRCLESPHLKLVSECADPNRPLFELLD